MFGLTSDPVDEAGHGVQFGKFDRVLEVTGGENFRIAIQQCERHPHQGQGGFRTGLHSSR